MPSERTGPDRVVGAAAPTRPGAEAELPSSRRDEVHLPDLVSHIDHICQLAGDSLHAGLGSDFDGGFGLQSVPPEIDTVADLQKLASLLGERGYSETDVENILGKNWLKRLERDLPS